MHKSEYYINTGISPRLSKDVGFNKNNDMPLLRITSRKTEYDTNNKSSFRDNEFYKNR